MSKGASGRPFSFPPAAGAAAGHYPYRRVALADHGVTHQFDSLRRDGSA